MSQQTDIKQKWAVASYALQDAYTDFILSRQAMMGHSSLDDQKVYSNA